METISRLPRRLTQLYSDTKTSCTAVASQDLNMATTTPSQSHSLHRKLRIQKDRLIAWGVEWSDSAKGDIDESVEQAGLTTTVASVLGTIKEILEEAENMNPAAAGETTTVGAKGKSIWLAPDRARYEDLVNDIATSIDILYDLSRARRSQRAVKTVPTPPPLRPFLKPEYNASDLTLVNPPTTFTAPPPPRVSTSTTPKKIALADLFLSEEEPPSYDDLGTSTMRVLARLRGHNGGRARKTEDVPVLVEYATYDAAYKTTQMSPPRARLDTLLRILGRSADTITATLSCLGYFEDPLQPRFGLVYALPPSVVEGAAGKSAEDMKPVSLLSVLQTGSRIQHNPASATPALEERFRLALNLAVGLRGLHAEGFVHGNVSSDSVLVFRHTGGSAGGSGGSKCMASANTRALQYALREPMLAAFDLFSEYDIETTTANTQMVNIYCHPNDPKATGSKDTQNSPRFDLYSLGIVLLEIGLWLPLFDMWKSKYTLADFKTRVEDVYVRRLASKCGSTYMQVVRDCIWAADTVSSGTENSGAYSALYSRVVSRLQRCCMLDESEPLPLAEPLDARPGPTPLKRKSVSQPPMNESPSHNASYKHYKRWAIEKGSQALERTMSLSKSPKKAIQDTSSPPWNPTERPHLNIRKSISESLGLTSPREVSIETIDWSQRDRSVLEDSGTLVDTPQDPTDTSSLYSTQRQHAASIIQRAWRASRVQRAERKLTLKEYKDKILLIQKVWRQRRKNKRSNTIEALLTDGIRHWPQATLGYPTTPQGYPTPEPDLEPRVQDVGVVGRFVTTQIQIQTNAEPAPRPKLRLHPVKFADEIVDEWHITMLPRLEKLMERALRDSDETISIDLVGIGETQDKARPTIFITCSSAAKVKAVLNKRFRYNVDVFDLKVRKGKIRRSKMNRSSIRRPPHRSMKNIENCNGNMAVLNPYHQQRPLCGASIGAFRGQHLPPVSFGGVIIVDDEPLGMSVHHLLDVPSDDESDAGEDMDVPMSYNAVLSSAAGNSENPWLAGMGANPGLHLCDDNVDDAGPTMWNLELSDDESLSECEEDDGSFDWSDSEGESDAKSDYERLAESTVSRATVGDIDGIHPGEGEEIRITQPAIDDVDDDFFPSEEDKDDDHLSSHELGHIHASSGIRRWNRDGIVHEIDWALLKLNPARTQPYNICQGGRRFAHPGPMEPDQRAIASKLSPPVNRRHYLPDEDEYPNGVVRASALANLHVHCFGRTTGLQGGTVGPAMSSVRIYARKSFSRSWHVAGGFGVGGDSGAWVVQNSSHRVVGHVLAWCARNAIAYICPMEVMFDDIKRTLGAKKVFLPGSAEHVLLGSHGGNGNTSASATIKRQNTDVESLQAAVGKLGIVDSAVDVSVSVFGVGGAASTVGNASVSAGKRTLLQCLHGGGGGGPAAAADEDKENFPRAVGGSGGFGRGGGKWQRVDGPSWGC